MPPRVRPRAGGSGGWIGDGKLAVTLNRLATILKYLKPEITYILRLRLFMQIPMLRFLSPPKANTSLTNGKRMVVNLTGETNATLTITDANATQHDGNYSVVVSNDFGSVESGVLELKVIDAIMNGLVAWWKFDETNGTVAYDSSGNGNDGNL